MTYELSKTARQAAVEFMRLGYGFWDYEEVVAEAYLAMMEAARTWDHERGCTAKSWTAHIVKQQLCRVFLKNKDMVDECIGDTLDESAAPSNSHDPETLLIIKETFDNFSITSKEVLKIIFEEPPILPQYNKNAVKQAIKSKLREKEYPWWRIQESFSELIQYANKL